ncbi:hypothetical protein LAZ67_14000040 [Cordylochernes scorpioides]|uniref:Saposin B-type domain-containing protein n=1 Tax=Cordylochernes scorpioides TaxID=51811 RepID=A0ABY6LA58_9ARAC|nr:hypothetical protein LAZ67_14000040 [Cordylochernes scorpioides]
MTWSTVVLVAAGILCVLPECSFADKVGQPLLCDGCVGMIKELHKDLKDSQGRRRAIVPAIDNICQLSRLVVYKFSPPKMVKACVYILETYRKELEESLANFYKKYRVDSNHLLQEQFCDHAIHACDWKYRNPGDEVRNHASEFSIQSIHS